MATERSPPGLAEPRLKEALADTPVVLIHGPRQCGKTTLARHLGARAGYAYKSFDDEVTLAAARSDPIGFVADLPAKCILDEVQRAPGIFSSLKMAVGANRAPGRRLSPVPLWGGHSRPKTPPRLGRDLAARIAAGGYPAALARGTASRRASWYRDYVGTMVQRDVRDLAR